MKELQSMHLDTETNGATLQSATEINRKNRNINPGTSSALVGN